MTQRPTFLMTDPGHFDVSYQINPWMRPDAWARDPAAGQAAALRASADLRRALIEAGAQVEMLDAVAGLPDLVFPANAGVVLDGTVLLARFRYPERGGEEAPFRQAFEALCDRGLVERIVELPPGLLHEGAGDAHWDASRRLFWTGYGPRSSREASDVVAKVFGQTVVPLELATDQFYHLDTCLCPLSGGEVLYYPPAFTDEGLAAIRARVAPADRIEASAEEAAAFCVNAVSLDRALIMAKAPPSLSTRLEARGYRLVQVDLAPFILSGGASFCMTLRLDLRSAPALALA
jgi:N-dimethylarginine dimethylaminohydrolase